MHVANPFAHESTPGALLFVRDGRRGLVDAGEGALTLAMLGGHGRLRLLPGSGDVVNFVLIPPAPRLCPVSLAPQDASHAAGAVVAGFRGAA